MSQIKKQQQQQHEVTKRLELSYQKEFKMKITV